MQVLTSLEEAHATASEREGEARAKYSFNAQTGLELSFKKVRSRGKSVLFISLKQHMFPYHIPHPDMHSRAHDV